MGAPIVMDQAGFHVCFLWYAVSYITLMDNVRAKDGKESAWNKLRGSEFASKRILIGSKVLFRPHTIQGASFHKIEARGRSGFFAGYVLSFGSKWDGYYLAWCLEAYRDAD